MHRIHISLLGAPVVEIDGQPARGLQSDTAHMLLAYLAIEGRTHARAALATLLWPDMADQTARHNLRQTLYQVNRAVAASGASDLLTSTRDQILLAGADHITIDVAQFLAGVARDELDAALSCYRGALLSGVTGPPGRYVEWLEATRADLDQRARDALSMLASRAFGAGEFARALSYARRHLVLDSFADGAHQIVLRALIQTGDHAGALTHFRAYEKALAAELGLAPSGELRALFSGASVVKRIEPAAGPRKHDLSDLPAARALFGRERDLAQLKRLFDADDAQLVVVSGLGGIGKTSLASAFARAHAASSYDVLVWRSISNAPTLSALLRDVLATLTPDAPSAMNPATDVNALLRDLLTAFRRQKCLLVIDNVESVFDGSGGRQRYRTGYDDYGALFERVAQESHRSHVLLTSRELPPEIVRAASNDSARILKLGGIDAPAVQRLLGALQVDASPQVSRRMATAYSGNPLAIQLVARATESLYGGDIGAFLSDDRPALIDDVRRLIDTQFDRLSHFERCVFFALALARVPTPVDALMKTLLGAVSKHALTDALLSLERRSLIESENGRVGLQNVVLEYAVERFVDNAVEAVFDMQTDAQARSELHTLTWIDALAPDHLRESQTRCVMRPICERALARCGHAGLSAWMRDRLASVRANPAAATSYAAGNLMNLLAQCDIDMSGMDFSGLTIRHAYLPRVSLAGASFAHAGLADVVFRHSFSVVKSLAFDSTGQRLAMGTSEGHVRLWNFEANHLVWSTRVHNAYVWGLAVSADGYRIVSGGNDGRVCVLAGESGAVVRELQAHPGEVTGIVLNHAASVVFSACAHGLVRASAINGGTLWERQFDDRVPDIALSPDGSTVMFSLEDGTMRLLDAATGAAQAVWRGHQARVKGIAFSPDGLLAASGSDDMTVRVWDRASGKTIRVLTGHTAWVWGVRFSPDGRHLASSGDDQTIRIWRVSDGVCEHVIRGHNHWVRPMVFHPTNAVLVSAGDDQTVRMWELHGGKLMWMQQGYANWIRALSFQPTTGRLAVATADHHIRMWQPGESRLVATLKGHSNVVTALAHSHDGHVLVSGAVDATARVWDVSGSRAEAMHVLRGHQAQLYAVAANRDGSVIATGSADHTAMLWHRQSERCLATLRHSGKVYALALTPDDAQLITSTSSATVNVWDMRTHALLAELHAHPGGAYALAIDPTGRYFASGGTDKLIHLWDLRTRERRATLTGHSSTIYGLAFSPDGAWLASGGYDRSVRLWNMRTQSSARVFQPDSGFMRSVAFSPDGRLLVSGGSDEWVCVWREDQFRTFHRFKAEPPYSGLNITGVSGITAAQRDVLRSLGAVEFA